MWSTRFAPGALVQIVDILRHDQQFARPFGVEPGERAMGGVRLDRLQLRPPRVVEVLHQRRIAPEGLGRADILDPMPLPQSVRPAKGGKPALGRDAGAGKDHDVADVSHFDRPESRCQCSPWMVSCRSCIVSDEWPALRLCVERGALSLQARNLLRHAVLSGIRESDAAARTSDRNCWKERPLG